MNFVYCMQRLEWEIRAMALFFFVFGILINQMSLVKDIQCNLFLSNNPSHGRCRNELRRTHHQS